MISHGGAGIEFRCDVCGANMTIKSTLLGTRLQEFRLNGCDQQLHACVPECVKLIQQVDSTQNLDLLCADSPIRQAFESRKDEVPFSSPSLEPSYNELMIEKQARRRKKR